MSRLVEILRARGVAVRLREGRIEYQSQNLDAATLALLTTNHDALMSELSSPPPTESQLRSLDTSDAELLAMLAKIDAVDRLMAAAPRRGCNACGREDWYEDSHPSHRVCRHCHPPYGTPRPAPVVAAAPVIAPTPPTAPGTWTCPRGHGSDPSHWRRWGCGACRLQAEVVS